MVWCAHAFTHHPHTAKVTLDPQHTHRQIKLRKRLLAQLRGGVAIYPQLGAPRNMAEINTLILHKKEKANPSKQFTLQEPVKPQHTPNIKQVKGRLNVAKMLPQCTQTRTMVFQIA